MEQNLESNSLHAFEMLCNAANEYNNSEFKFFKHGYFKYVRESEFSILIEDIYIIPEFRGTPASSIVLSSFKKFLDQENILHLYGRVMKFSSKYRKRISTFEKWGLKITLEDRHFSVVSTLVKDLK